MSTRGRSRALPLCVFPICLFLFATFGLCAAERTFASYASVKAILAAQKEQLPAELKNPTEAKWTTWSRRHDKAIRARLTQGDLDSMVNLLLLGTSFTRQPQIHMQSLTEASKAGILRARVDDLTAGLRNPEDNERLIFLQELLQGQGLDPSNADGRAIGTFVLKNLQRVIEERSALAQRAAEADAQGVTRSSLFRDRGVSLDTGIFPNFAVEQSLRDLKDGGVLHEGQVSRVAVIGPGLDFIDKNEESAFDYYPQQTLQPFALYDSLLRLRLAKAGALSMSILDISPRVIGHVRRARERAAKGTGYVIQLPRDADRPWPAGLVTYWSSLGDQVGLSIEPIRPPKIFPHLETRAVRIRPEAVLACQPIDLDIVFERLNLTSDRFDLIVGTNIFVYYDPLEQSLAAENIAAMLNPDGILLTNDRLSSVPGGSLLLGGVTAVQNLPGVTGQEGIGWYRQR